MYLFSHRTEYRWTHTLFWSHTLFLLVKSTTDTSVQRVNMTSEGKEEVRRGWDSIINLVTLVNA